MGNLKCRNMLTVILVFYNLMILVIICILFKYNGVLAFPFAMPLLFANISPSHFDKLVNLVCNCLKN